MAMTNGAGPRVVALLNQKGGVGKTTTTANLGHALAIAGKRVCLVDLDPQGHLTLHLGIEAGDVDRTVYDLMVDEDCAVEDCVIREARPNLDVVLAEVDLAGAESELARRPDRRTILRDRFAGIADRYDVVLIDCPPSLGLLTVNALTMADELFVPMQAHFLALQGVGRLLETVRLVCSSVNAELTVAGVILCMFERQTTLAKEILADLEDFFENYRDADVPWSDCRVLQPPIRRNIKLAEAPSFGNTIFDYAPWCPGAIDYRRLAASLLERWGQAVEGLAPADADEEAEESGGTVAAPGDGGDAEAGSGEVAARDADGGPVSVGPSSRGTPSVGPPRTAEPAEPPTIEVMSGGAPPPPVEPPATASPSPAGDGTVETPVRGDVAAPSRVPARRGPGTTEVDGADTVDASPGPDPVVPDADVERLTRSDATGPPDGERREHGEGVMPLDADERPHPNHPDPVDRADDATPRPVGAGDEDDAGGDSEARADDHETHPTHEAHADAAARGAHR